LKVQAEVKKKTTGVGVEMGTQGKSAPGGGSLKIMWGKSAAVGERLVRILLYIGVALSKVG